jgi:hypothetical protein
MQRSSTTGYILQGGFFYKSETNFVIGKPTTLVRVSQARCNTSPCFSDNLINTLRSTSLRSDVLRSDVLRSDVLRSVA